MWCKVSHHPSLSVIVMWCKVSHHPTLSVLLCDVKSHTTSLSVLFCDVKLHTTLHQVKVIRNSEVLLPNFLWLYYLYIILYLTSYITFYYVSHRMVSKPVHLTWLRGRSHKVIQAAKTSVNSQSLGCCILQRGLGWILATCHNPFITTRQNTIDVVQTSIKKNQNNYFKRHLHFFHFKKIWCDGDTKVLSRQKRRNPWTVRRLLTARRILWFLMIFFGLMYVCTYLHI